MTYAIGDQVEDYVLTERGWVPQLDLDTSPFRPGHVVNDAILTGALQWQPLRTAPVAPYQVGDVVEGYVLVPSGDWVPLAGQVRDRSGAQTAAPAKPTTAPTTQPRRTAGAQTAQPQPQPAPQVRAQTQPAARPQAQPRPQARPRTQTPRSTPQPRPQQAPRPSAQPQYRVGQVVNGRVLTADRGWVPLTRPQTKTAAKSSVSGRALFGVLVAIVVIIVRSCS